MKKAYKKVGKLRFGLEALLKLWQFQTVVTLILFFPIQILNNLVTWTANSTGSAATTANLSQILNWRLPVIILLGFLIMLIYFTVELLSQIYLCENILNDGTAGVWDCLKQGFKSLKAFANLKGLLIILYIIIGVPICGMGFSVSATKNFYIPNFITSVIWSNPLYTAAYLAVICLLLYLGRRLIFVFHAIIIDKLNLDEAIEQSKQLLSQHRRNLTWRIIRYFVLAYLLLGIIYFLAKILPYARLDILGKNLPIGYTVNLENLSDLDAKVLAYRIFSALTVYTGSYIIFFIESLITSGFLYESTKIYNIYTKRSTNRHYVPKSSWPHIFRAVQFIFIIGVLSLFSVMVGYNFDSVFHHDPVKITAHRTGGYLASENSLEGIDAAVEHNCYGSETDIQRTADQHYIINHDNTFKRLTGDSHKPGDLTLEQIKELRIHDTTGNGNLLEVPTMEELLDRGKDRIILFLELKGVSADKQMADDVVAAVRERDMVDDVILISLNYDVLDYVEKNYPEFETGVLIFSALGDVSRLNCDMIIMEEEMSSANRISSIHSAGKKVGVWTVNSEYSLYHFLDSDVDVIITDNVEQAIKVQKQLDQRTDLEILEDSADRSFN